MHYYPSFFFFQAEDGIRYPLWSRGLGDVYKRQLQTYAQKLATRVLEEGRSHQTDPMSNSERKIIHRIISRMDGVTSYSEGDEPNRYVVVDTE